MPGNEFSDTSHTQYISAARVAAILVLALSVHRIFILFEHCLLHFYLDIKLISVCVTKAYICDICLILFLLCTNTNNIIISLLKITKFSMINIALYSSYQ